MIPTFPEFKHIDLSDKQNIEEYLEISHLPPYTKYLFSTLFFWNFNGDSNFYSTCSDNLVFKWVDVDKAVAVSLSGTQRVDESLEELFQHVDKIQFVCEDTVKSIKHTQKYLISEDRNNFDYVYDVNDLAELTGSKYSTRRRNVQTFNQSFPDAKFLELDLKDPRIKNIVGNFYRDWISFRALPEENIIGEIIAFARFLEFHEHFNVTCYGVFIDKTLIGYSVVETINKEYTALNFIKGHYAYVGSNAYLYQRTCKDLAQKGFKYVNGYEDIGYDNLRFAKTLWRPAKMLKSYTIELK